MVFFMICVPFCSVYIFHSGKTKKAPGNDSGRAGAKRQKRTCAKTRKRRIIRAKIPSGNHTIALESCGILCHVSDLAPAWSADSDLLVGLVTLPCRTFVPQKTFRIELSVCYYQFSVLSIIPFYVMQKKHQNAAVHNASTVSRGCTAAPLCVVVIVPARHGLTGRRTYAAYTQSAARSPRRLQWHSAPRR